MTARDFLNAVIELYDGDDLAVEAVREVCRRALESDHRDEPERTALLLARAFTKAEDVLR